MIVILVGCLKINWSDLYWNNWCPTDCVYVLQKPNRVEKYSQGCVITNKRIITEYTLHIQAFFPVVRNWVPPLPHTLGSDAPSPFGSKGGDTLGCGGGGGWGTQLRRRDRLNVQYTIISVPLRELLRIHVFQVALRSINMLAVYAYYLIDAWHLVKYCQLKRKLFKTLTM